MKKEKLTKGDWKVAKERAKDFDDNYGIGMLGNKETKEQVFDWIEEYNDMEHVKYSIKFLSKKEKSKGFKILLVGEIFNCRDNWFGINGITKRRLDKAKIKYKIFSEAK